MPNEEVLKYIKDCLSQNYTKEQIKQSLVQVGWENSQIDEVLLSVQDTVTNLPPLQPKRVTPVIRSYMPEETEAQKVPPRSILPLAIIAGTAVIIVAIGVTLWILTKNNTNLNQLVGDQNYVPSATSTELVTTSFSTDTTFKLTIEGVTENDIRAALDAAKKVQDLFNTPVTPKLTPEQEKELQKQVESILATQKALSDSGSITTDTQQLSRNVYYSNYLEPGSPALVLREQASGNKIKLESVRTPFDSKNLKKSFFIVIFKDANGLPGKIIGSQITKFGGSGSEVTLTEIVSNEMLYAMIFEDNSDGALDLASDQVVRGENNLIIITKFKVIQ